jgi:protein SCO1/2
VIKRALVILSVLVQPALAVAHDGAVSESAERKPSTPPAGDDEILAPPPTYKANDVKVDEKLGARVPLDVKFRRHDGNVVTLGHVLQPAAEPGKLVTAGANDLPTIITFNYSECPMLCSLQLNGLMTALPEVTKTAPDVTGKNVTFRIGHQFRIVTISLEPSEKLERAKKMRDKYIARLPEDQRAAAEKGWTFLVANGDANQIKRVAEAVGFSYVYVKERAEWAHPAALIFLSVTGTVTRYVYGIEFDAQMMRESIFKAGISEPATAVGFMNRCYHFDPSANDHSRAGMMALRVGAAGFMVLLAGYLGFLFVRRNARRAKPEEVIS